MHHETGPRTWNSTRWGFALVSLVSAGILGWLVLHEGLLQNAEARALLLVPTGFSVAAALLAVLGSDKLLRKLAIPF